MKASTPGDEEEQERLLSVDYSHFDRSTGDSSLLRDRMGDVLNDGVSYIGWT